MPSTMMDVLQALSYSYHILSLWGKWPFIRFSAKEKEVQRTKQTQDHKTTWQARLPFRFLILPPPPGIEATTKGEHVKGDGLSLFYFDLVKIYRDIILETFCDPFLLFPIHISPPYSRSAATTIIPSRIPCILKKKKDKKDPR